jgi:hypothetical protein
MYSRAARRGIRAHQVMFPVCALCTTWLVAQNAVLMALLPWERLASAIGLGQDARSWVLVALTVTLVPAAFAAGWLMSRVAARAAVEKEGRDA